MTARLRAIFARAPAGALRLFARTREKALRLAVLSVSMFALSAEAEPECQIPTYEWELELTRVEALAGDADLNVVAKALGSKATLRGGYFDPARPKDPARAELVGSIDGAGLSVGMEKKE